MIAKGQDLFGKYRLLEKIGEGGMGEVWLVDNLQLDRKSALKLIKPEIAYNDKGWRRFQREARLMAKLEHPNAVVVYDFKRTHSIGYIEMEFVRGRSLDKYLKEHEGEQLSLEWIAALLDQLCAVLQEAHGHLDEKSGKPKPIIHRDLKPSNLMLMDRKPPGQNLKVLDFGIAKMIEEDGGPEVTLTAAGDLLGTPAFMSPEQIRGGWGKDAEHEVDNRSDLYSVGVLLYQLLTGKTPFRRRDSFALLAAHLSEPPPPMKEMNPKSEIPSSVERLVMQCLDKDPTKRPQNAQELSRMFREAAGLSVERLQPKRNLWLAVAAACFGIGLLGVLAHSLWPSPSPGDGHRLKLPDTPSVKVVKVPDRKPATLPDGYKPVESSPLAEGSDEYLGIVRKADSVVFHRVGPGIYLPEGYEPATEDWDPNSGAWPPAIVRKPENVRFILISGGTYRRGDPDGQAKDVNDQPITPHWVLVRSFYIQETEVTNAEVEDYVNRHAGDAAPFQKWRDFYTKQKQKVLPEERARRLPAACISYLTARRFAREQGGQLPTEAEWEFAAKSRESNRAYPWGNDPPVPRKGPKANISNPFNTTSFAAAVVRDFPSDRTDQGIYDMAGNVSELCLDRYKPYGELDLAKNNEKEPLEDPGLQLASGANDPAATFVLRGGSFISLPREATTFYRGASVPDESPTDVGFRVVVECPVDRR
jgi:serine/threonine-protein kinase